MLRKENVGFSTFISIGSMLDVMEQTRIYQALKGVRGRRAVDLRADGTLQPAGCGNSFRS
jgi:hypothetical protein